MERFLFRLSQSAHADRFILKGALMLRVWCSPKFRPTMDIDMLGRTSNEGASIVAQIREIMAVDVEPDGLTFDPESIPSERITEDAEYEGIGVRFRGTLDSARVNMQVGIEFGDIIYPEAEESDLPTMLDSPIPRLLCYSQESARDFCARHGPRLVYFYRRSLELRGRSASARGEGVRLSRPQRGCRPSCNVCHGLY